MVAAIAPRDCFLRCVWPIRKVGDGGWCCFGVGTTQVRPGRLTYTQDHRAYVKHPPRRPGRPQPLQQHPPFRAPPSPPPPPPHPCLAARPPLLPQRARRWPGARRGLRGREPGARTSPHPSLSPSLPAAAGLWAGEVGLLPGSPAGCCSPRRGPAPPAPQPPSAARASDRRTLAAGSRGRPPKARRVDISVARATPCPRQQSTGDPERQPAPRLLLQPPAVSLAVFPDVLALLAGAGGGIPTRRTWVSARGRRWAVESVGWVGESNLEGRGRRGDRRRRDDETAGRFAASCGPMLE